MKTTPDASPKSVLSTEIFSECSDSEPEEGDSTQSYAEKVTTKTPLKRMPALRPFKFRKLDTPPRFDSPTSSPIPLPSTSGEFVISSDEELENSMVKLEEEIAEKYK